MTNILLSFRHTKYSKIKVTVRPEQKRHLICPEIAWSVRIEHIVWFTWTDHAFTPNRWSVLFEAIACFPLLPFTLKHPWIKGCEGGMQIFILLLHYTLLTSDRKDSRFATNIKKEENPGRSSSFTIKITDCINVVITLLPYHQLHNRAPFSCWQAYDRTLLSNRQ